MAYRRRLSSASSPPPVDCPACPAMKPSMNEVRERLKWIMLAGRFERQKVMMMKETDLSSVVETQKARAAIETGKVGGSRTVPVQKYHYRLHNVSNRSPCTEIPFLALLDFWPKNSLNSHAPCARKTHGDCHSVHRLVTAAVGGNSQKVLTESKVDRAVMTRVRIARCMCHGTTSREVC